jgi:uncharacterized membrane protein
MFELPLHPVVVHFPIVLGILLPVVALILWWGIRKEFLQPKVWLLVAVLALAYGASAVVAVELGEEDEEKVEKIVSEEIIEEHEEAGELIPWVAGGLLLVSLAGLLPRQGDKARLALIVLGLVAIVPLIQTGHTGGELVYKYGAATAHLTPENKALIQAGKLVGEDGKEGSSHEKDEHEDDEDHES